MSNASNTNSESNSENSAKALVNSKPNSAEPASPQAQAGHFLKTIIENDLKKPEYAVRSWAGRPGFANVHENAPHDPARVRLRFPPEPNGYLHIGHAKAICINFGLASEYSGVCHMRFDDTNPEKESQEFADSILDVVQWLGFSWHAFDAEHLYYASNYFPAMLQCAEFLIKAGLAYVDEQSPEDMRKRRGTLTEPGENSPFRDRSVAENIQRFKDMQSGSLPDGACVLRAKVDMASPNINMRDPAIYRIKHAHHHRTGAAYCVYPMYTFAHPIEDALERITHSLCSLEFEDQRPFYDWLLHNLSQPHVSPTGETLLPLFDAPLPKQIEFARLNLSHVVTSKRKLQQLVLSKTVSGWDDPRMPTLAGLRRRGYTPEAIRLFCQRIGVSKADSWIDYSILEGALRDTLDPTAPRCVAVLNPVPLVLNNVPDDWQEECSAPMHPHHPELGHRSFSISKTLWIEAEDFAEVPPPKYFRLFPGNRVRLRYGYVIECTGCEKNDQGQITAVFANVFLDSKSGTPGADAYKVKGNIHWVSQQHGIAAEVRLYDRLFLDAQPNTDDANWMDTLNPNALRTVGAYLEPSVNMHPTTEVLQFERHGYFVADRCEHSQTQLVFNRACTLKDSWQP